VAEAVVVDPVAVAVEERRQGRRLVAVELVDELLLVAAAGHCASSRHTLTCPLAAEGSLLFPR